jgi:hypothetical protein
MLDSPYNGHTKETAIQSTKNQNLIRNLYKPTALDISIPIVAFRKQEGRAYIP